jgi:hypothetical protein
MPHSFVAYFDTLGFEWIFDASQHEKKSMWATLKGTALDFPIPRYAILRAQANPQRFPEIWAFDSELSLNELDEIAKEDPQGLADVIRQEGRPIFVTPKQKEVIK